MPVAHFVQKFRRVINLRHVPWAALVIPLRTGHQLPELSSVRFGMPLHDGAEASHLGGSAVKVQRRKRAGKSGNVRAPEQDAGCGCGKPGFQHTCKLLVLGLLVAAPVAGNSMLPGEACAAEKYALAADKIPVAFRIVPRIAVDSLLSGAAVAELYVRAVDELAAIGFKSVHAHVQQILTLAKPARPCGRVGKVRHHRAGKPFPLWNMVGRSVREADA